MMLKSISIQAADINEAFFNACRMCLLHGYEYVIDQGSFTGTRRKELDFVTVKIEHPGTRPLAPTVPVGVPPVANDDDTEKYLLYLMAPGGYVRPREQYTYGDDLAPQIEEVVSRYKRDGHKSNQLCMSVGSRDSLWLPDSQCLRVVDTCIRYGALHFVVYFRSWDLWAGFPVNLGGLQLLKEYMAGQIGVEDGEIIACSKGLHLYEHTWPLARALCNVEVPHAAS